MRSPIRTALLVLASLAVMATAAPPSPARADVLYGSDFNNELLTINPTTGAGTLVGPLDSAMEPYGLGVQGGNLYTYDQVAERVQQLNPATGATLATINVNTPDLVGEGDIAFRSDGIGFLSTVSNVNQGITLRSFDITMGTSAIIGTTPFLLDGLAFDSSNVLYGLSQGITDIGGSKLYTIDQTTGALTLVGALNVPPDSTNEILGGLAFAPDGTLFAELSTGALRSTLYTVDKSTGQATLVGEITGFGNVSGIRFLGTAAVPEPSSVALLGIGFVGFVAFGIRSRFARAGRSA